MTDESAGEIFALARDSFRGGQTAFEMQALPFHMTPENLARHRDDPSMPFWRMLKVGTDEFDLTLRPPKVDVCDHKYVFNADAPGAAFDASAKCPAFTVAPALETALANKQAADEMAFQAASAKLEEDQRQAAAHALAVAQQQQADAQQLAAEQQQEQAPKPSLLERLWGHKAAGTTAAPAEQVAEPATVAGGPPAKVAIAVPEPRLRPATKPSAGTSVPPATSVGTIVKKKFIWPGDDDNSSGAAAPASGKSL
jgi:hypothetical protein